MCIRDSAETSGEPIQTLAPELLTAAVQDFDSFMQAIQKISPVPIRFDEIDGNANGYYHLSLIHIQSRNERMFLVTALFLNTAKTKQALDNAIFQTDGIAQKYNCVLKRLDYQQEEGLMSSVPPVSYTHLVGAT